MRILAARKELHGLFPRHIQQMTEFYLRAGHHAKAIVLYQRGLETDELAEEFYQGLMQNCSRQYGKLHRWQGGPPRDFPTDSPRIRCRPMFANEQTGLDKRVMFHQGILHHNVPPVNFKEVRRMTSETSSRIKNGSLGVVIGAVMVMVIGFNWGGWVTAGAVKEISDEAVLASHAAICVAQFMKAPDHKAQLKAFQKIHSYNQSEFIEKGGWDKMPGEGTPRIYVSEACVAGINVMFEK